MNDRVLLSAHYGGGLGTLIKTFGFAGHVYAVVIADNNRDVKSIIPMNYVTRTDQPISINLDDYL